MALSLTLFWPPWVLVLTSFFAFETGAVSISDSPPSHNRMGDYILQGLGAASTATTSTLVDTYQTCQSSWVSWSSEYSKTLSPTISVITTYDYTIYTYNVTYGNADVYTTDSAGIPHAHGNITATEVKSISLNITDSVGTILTITTTNDATFNLPTPNCTIPFDVCSTMWQSYLHSLGKPTDIASATEPIITPVPTNRPRCSVGTAGPVLEPVTWDSKCFLQGNSVEVIYWPPNSATTTQANETVTAIFRNITMTSPSVYLSFDMVYAASTMDLDTISKGYTVPLGATSTPVGMLGGASQTMVGPSFTNQIIAMNPTEVSSLIRNFGPEVNTASALSEIAHGGPDYAEWMGAISDSGPAPTNDVSYLAKQIDFAKITQPDAEAYYLGLNFAPGCDVYGPHPQCSTIFDGAYKPNLIAPTQLRQLAPEWETCDIPLWGVYDPPIALTEGRTVDQPTLPGRPTTSSGIPYTYYSPGHLTSQTTYNGPTLPSATVTFDPSPAFLTSQTTYDRPTLPYVGGVPGSTSAEAEILPNTTLESPVSHPNSPVVIITQTYSVQTVTEAAVNPTPSSLPAALSIFRAAQTTKSVETTIVTQLGPGMYAFGSTTVSGGGSDATVSGHIVSAAPTGLVVEDASSSSSSMSSSRLTRNELTVTSSTGSALPSSTTSSAPRWLPLHAMMLVLPIVAFSIA